jgi:hypothetical protein
MPQCCESSMVLLRSGRRANLALWLWRCLVCESFEWTSARYDSKLFWVGAMGRAIHAAQTELVADAYSGETFERGRPTPG